MQLLDDKGEKEVESHNVIYIEKHKDKFKEVKKNIMNDVCDYPQCFVTIMAYNLMVMVDSELRFSI